MLVEGDFEKASRAAAKQKRRRQRAVPKAQASGGWIPAGSGPQAFWPRYLDICLVAAGVRCAVLLDTRRAPKGSPPLADVLDALCIQQQEGDGNGADGVACVGSLVLEGSIFLVNRALLLRRLGYRFPTESGAEGRRSSGVATEKDAAAAAAVGANSGQTSQLAPHASGVGGAGAERHQQDGRRTFALVDVRRSLALPCDRSDVLVPRLDAALHSVFGGVVADDAIRPPSRGVASGTHGGSIAAETAAVGDRVDKPRGDAEGEGARWLRDWGVKELVLDYCEGQRETLGGVGLCGLAGWLLEYPIIYCCPFQSGPHDDCDAGRAGYAEGPTTEQCTGNCLAAVPLTVYSLSVDLGNTQGSGSSCHVPADPPPGTAGPSLQAFSFSVPEKVCGQADAEGGKNGVGSGFQGLVDGFLGRLEDRIERHCASSRSGGYSRERQLFFRLNVCKRTETLDRVAL